MFLLPVLLFFLFFLFFFACLFVFFGFFFLRFDFFFSGCFFVLHFPHFFEEKHIPLFYRIWLEAVNIKLTMKDDKKMVISRGYLIRYV